MLATAVYMYNDSIPAVRTLIVGLGATGLSCARFLSLRGVDVAVTDSREHPPALASLQEELPDVALFLGGFDAGAFERAERIVVSPGVSMQEPLIQAAQQRGIELIGDIELFAQNVSAPVIAITGSNGKSTVTTLVGLMAGRAGRDVRVGGNLGTPALDLIQEYEPDLYVLELSSFQLETTHALSCVAASVLNISPDHLDRYASIDDYAGAKQRIFAAAEVQVVNRDDVHAASLAGADSAAIDFGLGEPQGRNFGIRTRDGEEWMVQGLNYLMPVAELRMSGRHNLANALAALSLGTAAALPMQSMLQALRDFHGLEHRTQWVGEYRGVHWFNDSKATNTGATLAAIQGFDGPLIVIAGGQGKGADFSELAAAVDARVKLVLLFGEAAGDMSAALQGRTQIETVTDMNMAVRRAAAEAVAGDTVLLSPACASFDMFRGYAHRGEVFMQAVRELPS